MEFEELTCPTCQKQYCSEPDLVPRLLPECGHTFCTKCLDHMLQQSEGPFFCPEDNTECARKESAAGFPKNFALIRLAEKTAAKLKEQQVQEKKPEPVEEQPQEQPKPAPATEELCPQHQRKLEIICIDDKVRICSNCALFGQHKNHEIRMETDVLNEIGLRTELLMEIYQLIDQQSIKKEEQELAEKLEQTFKVKSQELQSQLKQKFDEMKANLNYQQRFAEAILAQNLQHIENEIRQIKNIPQRLFTESDEWTRLAKETLNQFAENSNNPNYINFDMLESKNNQQADMLGIGEQLLTEFSMHNDVSSTLIDKQISQLDLQFDKDLVSKIEKVVDCPAVDGVVLNQEQLALYASGKDSAMPTITKGDSSTAVQAQAQVPNNGNQETKALSRDTISRLEDGDLIQDFNNKMQISQNNQQPFEQSQEEDMEEIDENLLGEIELYLKDIMENNEKIIDFGETSIGNNGAKCIAAAITLCDYLEVMKLNTCNIKDEGAISLFEELVGSRTVQNLDMSGNPVTEKCLDALANMLQVNQTLKTVEMKDTKIKNRFVIKKYAKAFGDRVIF